MCTTQPVFQVTINDVINYLCGKCIVEHSSHSTVVILDNNPVVGETCQCKECK